MRRAIFPGSFDPLTNGHLDIIKRSTPLFDEMIIAVLNNNDKNPMFTIEERCSMIREVIPAGETDRCNIEVASFSGLTAEFAHQREATAIVRGIRAVSDYEYELRMALMNRRLEPSIETVFLMAGEEYSYVSSTLMKQVFELGGRIEGLIPEFVETPDARKTRQIMIETVHHVQISIPVGAEDEARSFYCGLLGLREIVKPESLAGRGGFWLELGSIQIHFGAEDGIDRRKSKAHVAYLVTDIDQWREKVAAAGSEVIEGVPIPMYDRFEFRDPFGNRVELLQRTTS